MKKEDLMPTRIIGIVDNVMYIEGLYAGDHFHSATLTNSTKSDLIDRGVKEFASRIELDEYHTKIFWEGMVDARQAEEDQLEYLWSSQDECQYGTLHDADDVCRCGDVE